MRSPVYLIDCDGPLADFIGGVLPILSSILGREVAREEITEFGLTSCLGLTEEQVSEFSAQIDGDGWCADLDLMPGATQAIETLRKRGRVVVVTAPWVTSRTWVHDRTRWLHRHLGDVDVIPSRSKDLVYGNLLIDDKTSTLVKWTDARGGDAIQWATPHNRRDGWTGPSVSNWTDAIQMIAEMGLL